MEGIFQRSLFATIASITVFVPEECKYRVLSECLPWPKLADVANNFRAKKVDINNGAPLNLRLHLGAYIAQTMNGWTDRFTEDQIRYHAGVRILCGIENSTETIDHTSLEYFRNCLGKEGAEELNKIIVLHANQKGFTGSGIAASDTTVQEAPIAFPTEVGHLKNIGEKLLGIGNRIRKGLSQSLGGLAAKARDLFNEIRLFTKGKKEKILKRKKELGLKLHRTIGSMYRRVKGAISGMTSNAGEAYGENMELFKKMLSQIKIWIKTGFHPSGKIISLWHQTARAITRDKAAKATEFGRRWIITRLTNGYVLGRPCEKLGGDADVGIAEEALIQFLDTFGMVPESFIYDRGGDGPKNHAILANMGIKNNAIFRKGDGKMDVTKKVFNMAKRERALTEASIATLKSGKYGFNKPRAKSEEGCILKGQAAILGSNLNKFFLDTISKRKMRLEIG